jgi:hypothetical protein
LRDFQNDWKENNKVDERDESMIVIEFRKAGSTGEYYSAITDNCSYDGFIFESQTIDLQSGIELEFKIKHPDRDETINCSGDVAWITKQEYGFIAEVKLHSVPTEKQNILAEIIPSHPPADIATRQELKPAQSPSAEDRDPVQNESYSDRITESIVSAVSRNSTEEAGSTEERDISEAVSPEVRTEKSGSASKVKNGQGNLSPLLITVLIVSASAVLAGYLIHDSSTERLKERLSSLLMIRNTVSEVLTKDRVDERPLNEIKKPANAQIEEVPLITNSEDTFLDTAPKAADVYEPSRSAPTEAEEETVDPSQDSLDKPEKTETGIAVIEEKIDPYPGSNREATDLISDEDSPSESLNKGPETVETVASKRFIIYVSAWQRKEYAMSIKKKIMSYYPDAFMVFENNHHIIMVPNIASYKEALSISKELAHRLNLSPLIYVQQRNIPETSQGQNP